MSNPWSDPVEVAWQFSRRAIRPRIVAILISLNLLAISSACSAEKPESQAMSQSIETAKPSSIARSQTRILIRSGTQVVTGTLGDDKAARDFASLLPLTLDLSDYNGTEKISDLPRRLDIKESPDGITPKIGDITYFAPWGNLAIFYKDFGYSRGLIHLGRLDDSIETLTRDGATTVTIEQAP
jgi:hypothetical protein